MSKIYWFAYWFFLRGGIFLVEVARDNKKKLVEPKISGEKNVS